MSSWNTAGQMPQPEAPEGQQPGQMPGAMPQRQEPEEEENKTASDVSKNLRIIPVWSKLSGQDVIIRLKYNLISLFLVQKLT